MPDLGNRKKKKGHILSMTLDGGSIMINAANVSMSVSRVIGR